MGTIQKGSAGNSYLEVALFAGDILLVTLVGGGKGSVLRVQHVNIPGEPDSVFVVPVPLFGNIAGAVVQLLENPGTVQDHVEVPLPGGGVLQLTLAESGLGSIHYLQVQSLGMVGQLELPTENLGSVAGAVVQLLADTAGGGHT